jgi:iron complex outermembrane recepter protein
MKPTSMTNRSRLSAGAATLVMSIALLSGPAYAQDAQAAEEADAGDIIVTGSRIRQSLLFRLLTSNCLALRRPKTF